MTLYDAPRSFIGSRCEPRTLVGEVSGHHFGKRFFSGGSVSERAAFLDPRQLCISQIACLGEGVGSLQFALLPSPLLHR